jgi:uncharacterized protein YggE
MRQWCSTTGLCVGFALLLALTTVARGEDNSGGISVTGTGTVKGKPSEVTMQASISGDGELANDASVKYRDVKKKATSAFDTLKNPNLSVEFKGSSITEAIDPQAQMRMMQGQSTDAGKTKVRVSEQMLITLKDADMLEPDKLLEAVFKIVDTARDAGVQIGKPPASNYYEMQIEAQNGGGAGGIAQFKILDITTLKDQAYKLAVDDARANAQRLADLSGVKLGRVLSIQDEGALPNSGNVGINAIIMAEMGGNAPTQQGESKEMSSSNFGDIPVTVRLHIVFDIQK